MRTADETLRLLADATAEAKDTIREAHEARAALRDAVKAERRLVAEAITEAVDAAVGELTDAARTEMRAAVAKVIDRLAEDWRAVLGLDR